MQEPTPEYLDLAEVAKLGEEMERILKSDAFKAGITLARARIFEEWASAASPEIREIDEEGVVAREARRRLDESYTDLSEQV